MRKLNDYLEKNLWWRGCRSGILASLQDGSQWRLPPGINILLQSPPTLNQSCSVWPRSTVKVLVDDFWTCIMQVGLPDDIQYAQLTLNFRNHQKQFSYKYVPNIAWAILTRNNYLLLIWNTNLTGCPVFSLAESGNPFTKGSSASIFFSWIVNHLVRMLKQPGG